MKLPLVIVIVLLTAFGCSTPPGSHTPDLGYVAPKAVQVAQPKYPVELRGQGIMGGHAIVEFIVTKSGDAVQAHAVSATHPLFAAAAVEAVLNSKFTIPTKNGVPVNSRMRITVSCDLKEDEGPNQSPEPTATSVTPPAAQESRQP
jgi:TonB family protein